jgi:transposase
LTQRPWPSCCKHSRACDDRAEWNRPSPGGDQARRLPQRGGWARRARAQHHGADPFSETVYVFRAKRTDRVKLVFWDGTGLVLVAKRLEDGKFRWPKIRDGALHLSSAQLSALLEGLDWRRVHKLRPYATAPDPQHRCLRHHLRLYNH